MATPFTDDKSPICIPFILNRLQLHHQANASSSVGKSTLVGPLAEALERKGIPTLVCSIDDFYLTHEQQLALARENPKNALWQVRGEPGTHDIPLLKSVFSSLLTHTPTSLPQYDKALFSGQGDRLPASTWKQVNQQQPPKTPSKSSSSRAGALASAPSPPKPSPRNTPLPAELSSSIVSSTSSPSMRNSARTGGLSSSGEGDPNAGMTKEQVVKFVDAYYPAYELYSEGLRNGLFTDKPGAQLRMVVGRDRKVKQVIEI
ncbi:hypothetical protein TrVFT333_001334 [Trichoderma virens FT-333]|nr:hypothetical protein TrVFT333_001334 [Trichoderma virens FT-333]